MSEKKLLDAVKIIESVSATNEQMTDRLKTDMERELHEALMLIFRVAHIARNPTCMKHHKDWQDEFDKLKKALDIA